MAKGAFSNVVINVSRPEQTFAFYKTLLGYFDWQTIVEWPDGLGMSADEAAPSVWFLSTEQAQRGHPFNRDAAGLNHFGILVENAAAVDTFISEFMRPNAIEPQFDTPRARPDFSPTYYQVMFLDPEGYPAEVYVR